MGKQTNHRAMIEILSAIDDPTQEQLNQLRYHTTARRIALGDCPNCGATRCRCDCSLDDIEHAMAEVY